MQGEVEKCRICGGSSFREILNMGEIPLVDRLVKEEELNQREERFPLNLIICNNCFLVQLDYIVPGEKMFNESYAYDMSVTDAGVKHFHEMAEEIQKEYNDFNSILDIGSNTGVLLQGFKEQGWDVLGVEPSGLSQQARKKDIPTIKEFFELDSAKRIKERHGEFDIITATNVFAHIPDLNDAVKGVKEVLAPEGVFIIETPYLLDLIEKNEFDTIYHEHLSYFSITPLKELFDRHDMEIIKIERQEIHGGSVRVHVARKDNSKPSTSPKKFLERESELNIHSPRKLQKFSKQVRKNRDKLNELVEKLVSNGKEVAGIGAPAKGVVLLNYCNLDKNLVPYVSEKSDLKIGKYVPGTRNEIISDEELLRRNPDYALLLPWNFAKSIANNLEEFADNGGKFIIPVPEPHIVENKDFNGEKTGFISNQ